MNNYPLHERVLASDIQGVQDLIHKNVDLDSLDDLGQTALHWTTFRGDLEMAKILLEAGADPNILSRDGDSITCRAADFGFTEIETLLISFGGKMNGNEKDSDVKKILQTVKRIFKGKGS